MDLLLLLISIASIVLHSQYPCVCVCVCVCVVCVGVWVCVGVGGVGGVGVCGCGWGVWVGVYPLFTVLAAGVCEEYSVPYYEKVQADPSIKEMRVVVSEARYRPSIAERWTTDEVSGRGRGVVKRERWRCGGGKEGEGEVVSVVGDVVSVV